MILACERLNVMTSLHAEWSWHVISIVACSYSVKLCALATRSFQSQQNGAVNRMWRLCQVQTSQKEHAISAVCCKKEGMLLQPLSWHCAECTVHHQWNVRCAKNNTHIYVVQISNNRMIAVDELCCCLLPQCEALHTCRSAQAFRSQHHHQYTWKPFFMTILVFRKNSYSHSKCPCGQQGQT